MRDILSINNLTNRISEPTRITNTTRTLIDPILTTNSIEVIKASTLNYDTYVSDHRATFISISLKYNLNCSYTRKIWQYKHADTEKLNLLIMNTDWSSVICDAEDIDSATLNFSSKLLTLIRECIPEKTVIIRPKDKPWFDSLLRRTIRKRYRLRNLALKYRRETDWNKFRKTRNQVNNMKKHALINYIYYDNIEFHLDEAFKDNNMLYWKLMKEDTFKTKPSSDISPLHHVSDKGEQYVAFSD